MDSTNFNVEINSDVKSTADKDGFVLLDVRKGVYYSLNGTGGTIWAKLLEGLAPPSIIDFLAENFGKPHEQIRGDLQRFLQSLEKKGLIRINAE